MKITGYFWILSTIERKIAFGECKMFPCGYVSCTLPLEVIDWISNNELEHPDVIPQIGYSHQHTHDGGLFNEALLKCDVSLLHKYKHNHS